VATSFQVTFDCADPDRLAKFWGTALGYRIPAPPEGFATWEKWLRELGIPEEEWNAASAVEDPAGVGPRIFFQRVPERKSIKNRVHLDLNVSGGRAISLTERRPRVDAEVERLVAAGASKVGPHERHEEYWVIMQDPEGNEYCVQ
jgi:hypothetical protein